MKIAIRDVSLKTGLDRTCEIAHNLGFAGVELSLGGRQIREHPIWTRAGLRQLFDYREETRIEFASVYITRFQQLGVAHSDPRIRDHALKLLQTLIARAATLDVRTVSVPFRGQQKIDSPKRRKLAVAALKQAARLAEMHGVLLAVGVTLPPDEAAAFISAADSDAVTLEYDVADAVRQGRDPASDLAALHSIVSQIRIRDVDEDKTIRPLGMGTIDFQELGDVLDEVGYTGYLLLDMPAGDDPVASAAANLAYVQEAIFWM